MTGERRSKRVADKHNYKEANDNGFTTAVSRKARKNKRKQNEVREVVEDQNVENVTPSTSEVNDQHDSGNENIIPEMGRGSDNGDEHDTSDVDSDELEQQARELEELKRQVEEKKRQRTTQEKRDRKAKMAELRRQTEEKRRELQGFESETEEASRPKKRRESSPEKRVKKSKDGRGVKNKRGGKHANSHASIIALKQSGSREQYKHRDSQGDSSDSEIMITERTHKKRHRKSFSRFHTDRRSHRKSTSSSPSEDSSADSSTDSVTSSTEESESDRTTRGNRHKRSKKGKHIKSGVTAKAHKIRLKTSELCAQAVLDEEHYPGIYTLESLTFEQLVAGELEICTLGEVSKKEKSTRLQILKLLAYFANLLPQSIILDVYKAVILKVEKGLFGWSRELVQKTENMLDRAVSKSKFRKEENKKDKEQADKTVNKDKAKKETGLPLRNGERVIYCLEFNKNKCEKDCSHEGKFAGKDVFKQHICRVCLMTDKEKRNHAEGDHQCPHKSA